MSDQHGPEQKEASDEEEGEVLADRKVRSVLTPNVDEVPAGPDELPPIKPA